MKSTSTRCALLDELRGLDLISMMLYHGMWDLVYLFGVSAPWYGSWQGELWQQSICWVFILLSGFCLPLGRHPVKRGAVVFGCGALVTAVTLIFMPADVVWFGVLTLLGSAMIITGLLEKWMEKVPRWSALQGACFCFTSPAMQPMAICSWAIGSSHCRVFSTPTTSRPIWGFIPLASSLRITFH